VLRVPRGKGEIGLRGHFQLELAGLPLWVLLVSVSTLREK